MTDLSDVTPANTNPMPSPPTEDPMPVEDPKPVDNPIEDPIVDPKPTEETPKEDEKKPDTKLPEVPEKTIEPTGNEFVDSLLNEFKEQEVDVNKLFGNFLESGDENDIDFAYLEEKVGKLAAQGLIAGVRAENDKLDSKAQSDAQTIYDAAGGEQMWQGIIDWIASGESGLTKEGGEAYNKMLAEGGVQAELAAKELSNMFKQSPGFTQNADLTKADQVAQPQGIEPISRMDYVNQLDKIVREEGEYSPAAEALHKRREFTLRQGA